MEKVLVISTTYQENTAVGRDRPELPHPLFGYVHLFANAQVTSRELANALEQTIAGGKPADHLIVIGCILSDDALHFLSQNGITYEQ